MIIQKYLNKNKNINRGFRKLIVWQEAVELFSFVKRKINTITSVSYKVKAQVEDSAFSVHSNIAEGYSRRSLKENIQFNNIALSSLAENYSQVFSLNTSGDIEDTWFEKYDDMHYSIENKLINLNKSYIEKLKNSSDWKDDYILREIIEEYISDDEL